MYIPIQKCRCSAKVPPINKKLFAGFTWWERFSPMECQLVFKILQNRLIAWCIWPTQSRHLVGNFYLFCLVCIRFLFHFLVLLFKLFFVCFTFSSLFYCLWERERWDWVNKMWNGSHWSWGKKNIFKIMDYIKKLIKHSSKEKVTTCRPEEWSSVVKYLTRILEAWKALPSATNILAYMKNTVSFWYLLPSWDN